MRNALPRILMAEALGTLILVLCGIGTGIMGTEMAPALPGLGLLANAIATGLVLYLLITILGPVSGAHLNPAVSLYLAARGAMRWRLVPHHIAAQLVGTALAVPLAHAMFGLDLWQVAQTHRAGGRLMLAEGVATFGLLLTIAGAEAHAPRQLPALHRAWIAAAFWFTASASFANPAVTLGRVFSDTATGISPADAPGFIAAELLAVPVALVLVAFLFPRAPVQGNLGEGGRNE